MTVYCDRGETGMANAFEELRAEQAQADDQCADFLDVYEAWRQAAIAPAADRARLYRLEKRARIMWDALGDEKRAVVVEAMLVRGWLPGMVRSVLQIFGGRVVEII